VLNGIFWVLRSGAPWRDLPERNGPCTICYNRFVRWRKAGVWDRMMDAITAVHDGDIQMIDSTSVRAHQQPTTAKRGISSRERGVRQYPAQGQPPVEAVFQHMASSRTQPDRTVLHQTQALPPRGHPL